MKIKKNYVLLLSILIVVSSLIIGSVRIDDLTHKTCAEELKVVKICEPEHFNCLEVGGTLCHEQVSICAEKYQIESVGSCKTVISDHASYLETDQDRIREELKNEMFSAVHGDEHNSCEIMDKIEKIRNNSTSSDKFVIEFPSLASRFCKCSNESRTVLFESSFPVHMWHGGLSNKICWKNLDQHMTLNYCGYFSAEKINHEWAKYQDCIESSKSSKCDNLFFKNLKNTTSKSPKRLYCESYFDIIETYSVAVESFQRDYRIVFFDNVPHHRSLEPYSHNKLYLYNHSILECFENKRESSSCIFHYQLCERNAGSQDITFCQPNLIDCFYQIPNDKCKNKLIEEHSPATWLQNLWHFLLEHKYEILITIVVYAVFETGKYMKKRIVAKIFKEIGVIFSGLCMNMKQLLDSKTILLQQRNNGNNEGPLLPIRALDAQENILIRNENELENIGNNGNNENNENDGNNGKKTAWQSFCMMLSSLKAYSLAWYRSSFPHPDPNFDLDP